MKKALAIFLCVVMLLPAFCALAYAEDLTYEDVAAATREGGALAEEEDFPLDTLVPGGETPVVDGVVNDAEYALTKTFTDANITPRNNSKNYNGGAAVGEKSPEYVKVSINSDAKFFYFGIVAQYDNANEVKPSYNTFDLRFIISAKQGNVATKPNAWASGSPKQWYVRYDTSGNMQKQNVYLGNTTYDKENIYIEFSVEKAALISMYGLDASKPIDYIQYGFWIDSYKDDGMASATRIGYGYNVSSALAEYTGWPTQTTSNDWDDCYFTVKVADGASVYTYDRFAKENPSFPVTPVLGTYATPVSDGVVSEGEYVSSIQLANYETDVVITDGVKYSECDGGKSQITTPDSLLMYVNESSTMLHFAFDIEIPENLQLTESNMDFRLVISPQQSNAIPAKFINGTPMQIFCGVDANGGLTISAQASHVKLVNKGASRDGSSLVYEFSIYKAELMKYFKLSDLTCFTFGAWFYKYDANAQRFGYGYEMNKTNAGHTPITFYDNGSWGWDDTWLYFKLTEKENIAWEDLAICGLPFASVAPVAAAPVIDGNVNASEYTAKLDISDNVSNAYHGNRAYADKRAEFAEKGYFPNQFDVYFASDSKNIYIAMEISTTAAFNGSGLRLVTDFTDSTSVYKPLTTYRNMEIGTASIGDMLINTFNYTYGYNVPATTFDGKVENGVYSFELILDKELIKREYGLTGDITYMNFGIWMYNFVDPSETPVDSDSNGKIEGAETNVFRVGYGVGETVKANVNTATNIGLTSNANYDLDDCIIPVKFLDADGTPDAITTLNLSKYGQQTFYANQATTVENNYTDGIKNGEYALEYTFKNSGSAAQMGSILGNGTQSGDYLTFFVDYDDDYVYLAFKAHEDTLVPRYGTIAGQYDKNQGKYDNIEFYLSFNNDGTALNASKNVVLQCIPVVQSNGTLGFSCNVKTQRAGSDNTFDGVTGVWDLMNDKFRVFTGNWDANSKVLSYEIRLSKAEIAKAYGLEALSNVFTIAINHSGQYFTNTNGKVVGYISGVDQTGDGGSAVTITAGSGIKAWTNYWDGDAVDADGNEPYKELQKLFPAQKEGDKTVTFAYGAGSSLGFGHNVVMGSTMVVGSYVNTSDSASVRFNDGDTGMRFKSTVNKVYYDALVEKYGVDNVHFGTLITPKNYLDQATAFTKEALDLLPYNVKYLDVTTTKYYSADADTYTFLGSIANIKPANYDREFAAIGYIEYTDGDKTYTVYSDTYAVRSVAEVAEKALNDFTTDASLACGYRYAATDVVVGKTVYTPYTEAQRNIAKGFIA